MEKLPMCRICLVEDIKMYSLISSDLQEMYERLTDMPCLTMDKKPVQVCYLCRARLQNCHRLQATCLKSEEFLNKVMANNELKQMESRDLNTLNTVHPLIHISCVPSMRRDTDDDDKIDENNDVKFDPSAITPDAQVKDELYEDDSFINEAVDIKTEITVKDEDICTEDGDMSDNSHTMQDTQLQHDIQLKPVKVALERIDLEQFEIDANIKCSFTRMLVFDTWLSIKDSESDVDRRHRVFQSLTHLLSDVQNVNTDDLQKRIYALCTRLKTYWKEVHRSLPRMVAKYENWLNEREVCSLSTAPHNTQQQAASDLPSTSGLHHRKDFTDCTKRTQRRRIAELNKPLGKTPHNRTKRKSTLPLLKRRSSARVCYYPGRTGPRL